MPAGMSVGDGEGVGHFGAPKGTKPPEADGDENAMTSNSMVLSCRKASWFPILWSFPAGKRHGFQFRGPFLQESVMVFHSMILRTRSVLVRFRQSRKIGIRSKKEPDRFREKAGNRAVIPFLRSESLSRMKDLALT